ncbi:hypothetical protein ACIBI9_05580 [Nonomuraea sp. NPDC050451]|uniref:hypothetical protein n=1 Tax=Nonomuraea sp. NPDC050451 TaxID=3364364 RepID=UPI0037B0CC8F
MIVGHRVRVDVVTVSSWRELDDAISEAGRGDGPAHAHSTLVFRGLARSLGQRDFATASWPEKDAVLLAVDCAGAHRLLPESLRRGLEEEGALLFTTEMLAKRAPDLACFDRLGGEEPFLAFFEPPSLDERVVNQSSVLSVFPDPTFQLEQWLEEHPALWRGWVVPAAVKAEIRQRLDQANITERVLLPGLDGLADWLRRYYSPGSIRYGEADGGATMAE